MVFTMWSQGVLFDIFPSKNTLEPKISQISKFRISKSQNRCHLFLHLLRSPSSPCSNNGPASCHEPTDCASSPPHHHTTNTTLMTALLPLLPPCLLACLLPTFVLSSSSYVTLIKRRLLETDKQAVYLQVRWSELLQHLHVVTPHHTTLRRRTVCRKLRQDFNPPDCSWSTVGVDVRT